MERSWKAKNECEKNEREHEGTQRIEKNGKT